MKVSSVFIVLISFVITLGCSDDSVNKTTTDAVPSQAKSIFPEIPKTVEFCGKIIPIDNFDVRERLDKELIVNTYFHSSTIQSFKRANRYFDMIDKVLKREGVPEDFKYLCLIESGLTQSTSPSGAKGFWQFMPKTGKEFGLIINEEVDERLNVEKSTKAACVYLKRAYEKFNDWVLSAASYNRGMGGIELALDEQGVTDYFDLHLTNETSRYVFRILALKTIFENPETYGFYPDEMELYEPVPTRQMKVEKSINNLKLWATENGSNYRMLKILNPWILRNSLTISAAPYIIELPIGE